MPKDYAEHVREMIGIYGNFSLEIQELLVQDSKSICTLEASRYTHRRNRWV